jgi:hypothetical protein
MWKKEISQIIKKKEQTFLKYLNKIHTKREQNSLLYLLWQDGGYNTQEVKRGTKYQTLHVIRGRQ